MAFKSVCPGVSSAMFMTSPSNNDLHHPIQVERITVSDSTEDSKVFIHRPDVGWVSVLYVGRLGGLGGQCSGLVV